MNNRPQTDFLVSSGSLIAGMGTVFNLSGEYFEYNVSSSESEADNNAIAKDWEMVGNDLRKAISDEMVQVLK